MSEWPANAQVHLRASRIKASEASNPTIARQVQRSVIRLQLGSQKFFSRYANVRADLAQENRRDIAAGVHRHCCGTSVDMPKLLVRPSLPHLDEPDALKARDDLARFENRQRSHSGDAHGLRSDELRLEMGLAVLE
jgi:hypothetical protein